MLRQQIHAGAYADGLPSENELAAEFSVSRNTIREALGILKNEGLIDRGPKVGTHVAQRKYDHGLDALLGLKETFKNHGEVRNEVRAAMPVAAPPSVARRLRLQPGEQAVFIERLRYLGDLPLSLDLTYLAPDIGTQILGHPLEDQRPVRAHRAGERAAAGLGVAGAGGHPRRRALGGRHCRCPTARALLMLERLTSLEDGRPVDLEYIRMRGDRITMRGNLIRAEPIRSKP